jgi:hypothetical protein
MSTSEHVNMPSSAYVYYVSFAQRISPCDFHFTCYLRFTSRCLCVSCYCPSFLASLPPRCLLAAFTSCLVDRYNEPLAVFNCRVFLFNPQRLLPPLAVSASAESPLKGSPLLKSSPPPSPDPNEMMDPTISPSKLPGMGGSDGMWEIVVKCGERWWSTKHNQ